MASAQARFDREKFFPSGCQFGVREFLSLFHRYDYIYRPLTGGTWLSANAGWALSDTEILKAAAGVHPRFYLGARSGKASRYAVLDIDSQSKYHNDKQLKKLLAVLANAGLAKNVLFRSSRSGGWHLYFFFAEPISSRELHKQLHNFLSLKGFAIAKGQLEIFPNPGQHGSLGYGLRLPLQPGFAWLSKETQAVLYERDDMYALEAMGMFTADYHEHLHSYDDFQRFKRYVEDLEARKSAVEPAQTSERAAVVPITSRKKTAADAGDNASVKVAFFGKIPPGINAATWLAGRAFFEAGLTAPGQRADAIFSLNHYLFYGDPEKGLQALGYGYADERQWFIEKFLAQNHNGKSDDINKGRSDAYTQIERAAHWLPPHRRGQEQVKFKKQVPVIWARANEKRKRSARIKIAEALERLKAAGKQFTVRELWELSGCATDTLYRHGDIWRQEYEDLAQRLFANDPGEYNAVVGGDSPKNSLPSTTDQKITPLGLLAARQIAYELSMRAQKEKKKKDRQTIAQKQDEADSWKAQVYSALKESLDPDKSIAKLKTLLAFLIFMLMSAPGEEEVIELQIEISKLKSRILHQIQSAKLELAEVGRPPPAD